VPEIIRHEVNRLMRTPQDQRSRAADVGLVFRTPVRGWEGMGARAAAGWRTGFGEVALCSRLLAVCPRAGVTP
jgi:hypothetical protein